MAGEPRIRPGRLRDVKAVGPGRLPVDLASRFRSPAADPRYPIMRNKANLPTRPEMGAGRGSHQRSCRLGPLRQTNPIWPADRYSRELARPSTRPPLGPKRAKQKPIRRKRQEGQVLCRKGVMMNPARQGPLLNKANSRTGRNGQGPARLPAPPGNRLYKQSQLALQRPAKVPGDRLGSAVASETESYKQSQFAAGEQGWARAGKIAPLGPRRVETIMRHKKRAKQS